MSYIILRGRWCDVIVLNVHAACENKGDDVKDSFYEEIRRVFDQFPRYEMKILLGGINAEVGRENILQTKMGNESLHEISNDNGVRVLNSATVKNLVVRSLIFRIANFINTPVPLLTVRHTTRLTTFYRYRTAFKYY
jgi:hypothetical protein